MLHHALNIHTPPAEYSWGPTLIFMTLTCWGVTRSLVHTHTRAHTRSCAHSDILHTPMIKAGELCLHRQIHRQWCKLPGCDTMVNKTSASNVTTPRILLAVSSTIREGLWFRLADFYLCHGTDKSEAGATTVNLRQVFWILYVSNVHYLANLNWF